MVRGRRDAWDCQFTHLLTRWWRDCWLSDPLTWKLAHNTQEEKFAVAAFLLTVAGAAAGTDPQGGLLGQLVKIHMGRKIGEGGFFLGFFPKMKFRNFQPDKGFSTKIKDVRNGGKRHLWHKMDHL